jgi:hypothetical protein
MEAVLHGGNNTIGGGGDGAAGWSQRCIVGDGVTILLSALHGGDVAALFAAARRWVEATLG